MSTQLTYLSVLALSSILLASCSQLKGPGKSQDSKSSASQDLNVFKTAATMNVARGGHKNILLSDGRVAVIGGNTATSFNGDEHLPIEIYDSSTNKFVLSGVEIQNLTGFAAVLLPNGKILITGGSTIAQNKTTVIATARIFDPITGSLAQTGNLLKPRLGHTAFALPDGNVLIIGGMEGGVNFDYHIGTAEIYDPQTALFSNAGTMTTSQFQSATILNNGKILLTGSQQTSLLYDPSTKTFGPTGSMQILRYGYSAVKMADGRVLFTGGFGNSILQPSGSSYFPFFSSTEIYDPTTGQFTLGANMKLARSNSEIILLQNKKVLITGAVAQGYDSQGRGLITTTAELFDPIANEFDSVGAVPYEVAFNSSVLLPNGNVLFTGGYTNAPPVIANSFLFLP